MKRNEFLMCAFQLLTDKQKPSNYERTITHSEALSKSIPKNKMKLKSARTRCKRIKIVKERVSELTHSHTHTNTYHKLYLCAFVCLLKNVLLYAHKTKQRRRHCTRIETKVVGHLRARRTRLLLFELVKS